MLWVFIPYCSLFNVYSDNSLLYLHVYVPRPPLMPESTDSLYSLYTFEQSVLEDRRIDSLSFPFANGLSLGEVMRDSQWISQRNWKREQRNRITAVTSKVKETKKGQEKAGSILEKTAETRLPILNPRGYTRQL